ncbi:MAG TPA: phosphoribosylaminoimidazolesuccinocarboxamide synthase [Bacteroidetes bacterium]|nr:phosphoribosylaminoimidazolesuccinocarboxamide synthase [Bacteroidota bacterium]
MNSLKETNFNFIGQKNLYRGKVRDVYDVNDKIIIVATDRISAFDHVLEEAIPYKGQVLNQMSAHFLKATSDIVPNWLEAVPDPNVSAGKKCNPIRLEMVIRGYLVGHAWRTYKSGTRYLCGVEMPVGMKENEKFPSPIITPAFKADEGHDEDISKEEILEREIVTPEQYAVLEDYTYRLFERGTQMADDQGLILVDTKYEFGFYEGEIILIDEVHTPDSSRYFYKEGFEEKLRNGEKPIQLSKEFVREWLIENGFQGLEGQTMPHLPPEFIDLVSERYIELYERMTGKTFYRAFSKDVLDRIKENIENYLASTSAS